MFTLFSGEEGKPRIRVNFLLVVKGILLGAQLLKFAIALVTAFVEILEKK